MRIQVRVTGHLIDLCSVDEVELPEGVEKLISETFLRTVSRYPTNKEMELARADMAKSDNVVEGIQELLLALLNTKEFMVNH